jgi:hypothetical protein
MATRLDAGEESSEPVPNDVLRPPDAITDGVWPAILTALAGIATVALIVVIAIGFANS